MPRSAPRHSWNCCRGRRTRRVCRGVGPASGKMCVGMKGMMLGSGGLLRASERRPDDRIAPHMRILVAVEAVDGRKGIDSLAGLCRELEADPFRDA